MSSVDVRGNNDIAPTTANLVQLPGSTFNALIAELRADRKVVEAARWIADSTIDLYPPGNWHGLDELRAALAVVELEALK